MHERLGSRRRNRSIEPSARRPRSSTVRSREAKATRPGSYGIETMTSVRAASPSSSAHSAPVRSSNPYAKTGSPCHASSSDTSRSAERRLRPSRSHRPRRSSSSRYARASRPRSPSSRSGPSSADSTSPSVARRESAKPVEAAEAERRSSAVRPIAFRTASERCASVATGRASESPPAICSKRSSNVPIRPARSAERRRSRSRSTRSTSARFGTTSHGSRSSAARKRSRSSATLPA
jgi:hypothetical protein